ncbi:MAG: mechanosensitive ion channel [Muribaculaceae bacterium]|nr:mechanosensitive ion channel [Muribaculaceae bacterium]
MLQSELVDNVLSDMEASESEKIFEATDSIPSVTQELSKLQGVSLDELINRAVNGLVDFAFHFAIALIVFYIGKFIIGKLHKIITTIFLRRNIDKSLTSFTLSVVNIVLYFALLIIVIGILGIETSSFLAIFASAGVAVGLALSGTLQNFAGGVLILLLKPYKIGDYIEAQGFSGTIKEIQIFSTIINTSDNKQIIIPNGGLSTGTINNYSKEDYRRVDWTVSIAYGDDYDTARDSIMQMLHDDDRIVKKYIEDDREMRQIPDPEKQQEGLNSTDTAPIHKKSVFKRLFCHRRPSLGRHIEAQHAKTLATLPRVDRSPFIALSSLSASSVDITVRAWTRSEFFWNVYFDINEKIYKELPKHGINFPFPQMDVHILQNS